jgi:hypothetical protein
VNDRFSRATQVDVDGPSAAAFGRSLANANLSEA